MPIGQTADAFPSRRRVDGLALADPSITGASALLVLIMLAIAAACMRRRRQSRRADNLRRLLDLADRLESDLKSCRARLAQAHAVLSLTPDTPAASAQAARDAVEHGLRALLRQRLWIRDRAAQASQRELDAATAAMTADRDRLQPLLAALNQAQQALDRAMRQHIPHEPST